ncbi:MAG TPA: biopolymer transporter ExbD [Chroococcidiopsis sp.]
MKLPRDYYSEQTDVRIELIPLIDVIFCILTFFILAAMTLTRQTAINVDLPTASTSAPQMREMMIVSIDPIGQVYIDQQAVTRDALYQQLLQYHQTTPQGLIVLYASRLSSYNDVVEVLDLLRSVGGDRVALATLPESGAATTAPNFNAPLNPVDPLNPSNPFGGTGTTDPFDPNQPLFPGAEPITPAPSPNGSSNGSFNGSSGSSSGTLNGAPRSFPGSSGSSGSSSGLKPSTLPPP